MDFRPRNSVLPPVHNACWVWIGMLLVVGLAGCHRGYYRRQADAQAAALIQEKAQHPHWALDRSWVDVDPRSRMFDPFNPDCSPMPQDDPASHQFMHYVDHKRGYPNWHINGDADAPENPDWLLHLQFDDNGVAHLNREETYQLALLHSRDYQRQFETLYLSALDVSAERFRFDSQLFAGYSTFYTTSGRLRTPRSRFEAATYTGETGRLGLPAGGARAPSAADILVRKSYTTGADLAVGFANSLIWDFSSANTHTAFTILDLSFVQPLLRGAGRDRIMEQLTISERTLLANVRQLERWRRGFYVEIMTGLDAGTGPQRRGGFFGASGLEGFTGVGGGGFGGVGGATGGGGAGGFGGGGAGAAEASGYYGLLQTQQDIRNQQVTIAGLRSNLSQLRESLRENLTKIPDDTETILRERLQIAQARQALLNAESRLLLSQASYQSTLDGYKITLGLPPQLCVTVEDTLFDHLNLIDPAILTVQNEITRLRETIGDVNEQLITASVQPADLTQPRRLEWSDEVRTRLENVLNNTATIRATLARVRQQNLEQTRGDIANLRKVLPERTADLKRLQAKFNYDRERLRKYGDIDPCGSQLVLDIDPLVFDAKRLEEVPPSLETEIQRIEQQLASFANSIEQFEAALRGLLQQEAQPSPEELYAEIDRRLLVALPSLISAISEQVLDLSLVQARARADAVQLKPVDLSWDVAVELAAQYRRDWMNARAALVDSWRLLEFNADNLESTLDVVFDGDLQNVGDNPLRLRDINGQMRVGLRFDAPINRLQERNTYRQALIEYQQARRTYYSYVDSVASGLRNIIRTLDRNRLNFEARRFAVLSAIEQVVLNDQLQKLREERGVAAGATAARDVVSALSDLQTAQNDFLNVWVNYEVLRMRLDLDLGTMNLDPEGFWIDPGPVGGDHGLPAPFGHDATESFLLDPLDQHSHPGEVIEPGRPVEQEPADGARSPRPADRRPANGPPTPPDPTALPDAVIRPRTNQLRQPPTSTASLRTASTETRLDDR